jgi:8-hydroxy-5-deazaflavin:NADPH oxidoreductase
MKIGILGTGMVGVAIGTKLVSLGNDVKMGSRKAGNEKATAWVAKVGKGASEGTFADAAAHGDIVFNCTGGTVSVAAVKAAGTQHFDGKILIDVSNPLDASKGFPPTITFRGESSVAEELQLALPGAKVVKTLNTVNCNVMVDPSIVPGDHDVFVSGDNPDAKERVTEILKNWFGWRSVIDLGDISTARGVEAYILLWIRLWGVTKMPDFNIRVVRPA